MPDLPLPLPLLRAILQQQMPLHDYTLSSDHDYSDQYPGHANHQPYATGGAADHHMRRDGAAALQAPAPFAFTAANSANGARYVPDRSDASR
ncbi:Hypothetical predicted protein [Lecanosticta acicola]|uniref:Uncharacterized protein n=1 Tax=Lecanosticta acicola TaxID=111012 RepID=A0AAI8Z1P2_9PEZI|nr:Hypothetical predicted protein [Lecanosticta acicola]